ncbi:MAG: ABC transporter substrate-binding protein [Pirellulales bacterium]
MISSVACTIDCHRTMAVVFVCLSIGLARAQEPANSQQQRLLDRTPFDQVVLNQAGGGKTLDVLPLDLPQRPLAPVPGTGKLIVRLLERPTDEFEVSWADVAQVRVFEQLLLDEARLLTESGQFDAAFDYFAQLSSRYPSLPGLDDAINDYLRRNSLALYQANEHDRALALLLTLYQRDPKSAGLASAVEKVAGEIIQRYLREGDYSAARNVLVLWQTQLRGLASTAAAEWQRRFEAAATRQVDEATRLIQQKQYIPARQAVAKALAIWPKLDAATSMAAQIQRQFPFVTVGIFESAPRQPQRRIDSWPALRASRLTQHLLAEQVDFGAEGGIYRSPFAELKFDESGRELSIKLDPSASGGVYPRRDKPGGSLATGQLTADFVARLLLSMARPGSSHFRPDFASLLAGVSLEPPRTVKLHFSRIHVRPEALLQIPVSSAAANTTNFAAADYTSGQVIFAATAAASQAAAGLHAVVEQTMPDDEAAVAALLAGEIDILDRVPPWHLERLRAVEGVRVESYRLPTVHVLIPNADRPLLAKREFRRALCFGIDRQWIVQRALLAGASVAGFEVVSGPFPAGTSLSDPVRYGYNNRITPRPFEPRLAAILASVAWASVQSSAGDDNVEASADIPELTLAHPTDPVARLACQSIQAQLQRQGIRIKLKEFTADELLAGRVDDDLRYAELAVWEPATDARILLGPGSLTGRLQSPYLNAALRQLDEATNWNDVRARLAELHEIAHHDLPVIPLWQTINYFAYRTSVRGVGESPVTLYQNVDEWTAATSSDVAQAKSGVR